jgi:hypothetical protein
MKKITQTFLVLLFSIIASLIVPIFGHWYYKHTGIEPIGFYFISGFGGIAFALFRIFQIWDTKF